LGVEISVCSCTFVVNYDHSSDYPIVVVEAASTKITRAHRAHNPWRSDESSAWLKNVVCSVHG
jgi:hypothetical protein